MRHHLNGLAMLRSHATMLSEPSNLSRRATFDLLAEWSRVVYQPRSAAQPACVADYEIRHQTALSFVPSTLEIRLVVASSILVSQPDSLAKRQEQCVRWTVTEPSTKWTSAHAQSDDPAGFKWCHGTWCSFHDGVDVHPPHESRPVSVADRFIAAKCRSDETRPVANIHTYVR